MTNILYTSAGKRVDLIKEFKRVLKNTGKVILTDTSSMNPAKKFADKFYLAPQIDHPKYITFLLKIMKKEKISAILTAIDPEMELLVKNKVLFEQNGCKLIMSPTESIAITSDKVATSNFFRKNGILAPRIIAPEKVKRFPVFIRPTNGSGSKNAHCVPSAAALKVLLATVPNPIVTEFIEGQEYSLDCLNDMRGNIINIIPRKRIEISNGIAVKSIVDLNPALIQDAKKILQSMRVTGPSTIQCISNNTGNYFTEINLRFGGGSILGIKSGGNFVEKLIGMLRGKKFSFSQKGIKNGYGMAAYLDHVFIHD